LLPRVPDEFSRSLLPTTAPETEIAAPVLFMTWASRFWEQNKSKAIKRKEVLLAKELLSVVLFCDIILLLHVMLLIK